jgi:hypothetical protein
VLGLLKVTSAYYQPEHDLLSPQFRPAPRLIGGLPYQPPPRCPQPPAAATSLATAPAVRSLR